MNEKPTINIEPNEQKPADDNEIKVEDVLVSQPESEPEKLIFTLREISWFAGIAYQSLSSRKVELNLESKTQEPENGKGKATQYLTAEQANQLVATFKTAKKINFEKITKEMLDAKRAEHENLKKINIEKQSSEPIGNQCSAENLLSVENALLKERIKELEENYKAQIKIKDEQIQSSNDTIRCQNETIRYQQAQLTEKDSELKQKNNDFSRLICSLESLKSNPQSNPQFQLTQKPEPSKDIDSSATVNVREQNEVKSEANQVAMHKKKKKGLFGIFKRK